MNSHYYLMKTMTNERIQARFKEAERQRLVGTATAGKLRRPVFSQFRNLVTTIIAFIHHHPTPVIHWQVGRQHR